MLPGQVAEFDAAKGLGTIVAENGSTYVFHVIEIADGTRDIEIGQPVTFQPLAKFGRFQACRVRKI